MYGNQYHIKDYMTLLLTDAHNPGDGIFIWENIPTGYYTNQRASVCTVSVVGANLTVAGTHSNLLINYANGGTNIYSQANQWSVISHCNYEKDHGTHGSFTVDRKQVELLTNARPQQITLEFRTDNLVRQDMTTGVVTLEFCYYNAEETSSNYHNQFTPTLK